MISNTKQKREIQVHEAAIEDALATYPAILADILEYKGELRLIARQMEVPSGRIDLLCISRNRLFLIELKIGPYFNTYLAQVEKYRKDLLNLQKNNELVSGDIDAYLLTTSLGSYDLQECKGAGVILIAYEPRKILAAFYERMAGLSNFLNIKPKDYGVWHIHVTNRVLYLLPEHNSVPTFPKAIGNIATNTVRNHLHFAAQLGLVHRLENKYLLTDLGVEFIKLRDLKLSKFALSGRQIELLRNYIVKDPFASNIIFGVYSLIETIFTLSRNSYPVDINYVIPYFRESVGKRYDWDAQRSAFLGANAFVNFGIELGLLAKAGDNILLTPAGFRFVLMLQLHKGIKIVDSLGLGN